MSNDLASIRKLLLEQLPASVLKSEPELTVDGNELLIILHTQTDSLVGEGEERQQSERELIESMRNQTRSQRVRLARSIQRTHRLIVSWGMRTGETLQLFTNNSTIPVMTRLTREERQVLDALIAARVANTRSAAISYIVRTFATEHQDWLHEVQQVTRHMTQLREQIQLPADEGSQAQQLDQEKRIDHQE